MEIDDEPNCKMSVKIKLSHGQKLDLRMFKGEIAMFSKMKRTILRKKLKKDKLKLLSEVVAINKKLKVLDELDENGNKKK